LKSVTPACNMRVGHASFLRSNVRAGVGQMQLRPYTRNACGGRTMEGGAMHEAALACSVHGARICVQSPLHAWHTGWWHARIVVLVCAAMCVHIKCAPSTQL